MWACICRVECVFKTIIWNVKINFGIYSNLNKWRIEILLRVEKSSIKFVENSKITFFKHRWVAHFVCFQFLPTCFCFRLFLMDFHASSITHTRSSAHIYTIKSVGPRLLFGKTNTKCQTVVSFMPNLLLCMEHFLYIPSKFSLCVRWQDDLIWIIYNIIYVYGKNWVEIWILFALFNVLYLSFFCWSKCLTCRWTELVIDCFSSWFSLYLSLSRFDLFVLGSKSEKCRY